MDGVPKLLSGALCLSSLFYSQYPPYLYQNLSLVPSKYEAKKKGGQKSNENKDQRAINAYIMKSHPLTQFCFYCSQSRRQCTLVTQN